ncbi:unnamed protein product [Miscanthus lutarioriparius]|uniref:Uncharacterized protein n=1 Tax=Miscanthus lutarioriparius TaxID=422564 RepID=A0A811QG32_9POAL|nr:unnamed protein product [Miscanthus lutarioriparius]
MSSNSSPNRSLSPDVSSRIIDNETQEAERAESLNGKLVLATSSNDSSPQHDQSMKPEVYQSPLPEVSPNIRNDDVQDSVKNLNEKVSPKVKDDDVQDSVKSLNEKLSAALLTINAKEDLVKQHTRVAEEAVAGWEQAEAEVASLKQLLETASQKNTSLEDQVSHLDDALKECVRQLRQAREEQEKKIRDTVAKKSKELESEKSELQHHIAELSKQLEATKLEATTVRVQRDLQEKLQIVEKENKDLKVELLALSKDLKILARERDLSNQAAETASKLHLEIQECQHRTRNLVNNPVEIDLMDDFLEMEKLAALPEVDCVSSSFGAETDSDQGVTRDKSSKVETESLQCQVTDLLAQVEKYEGENRELEMALADARDQLGTSCDTLIVANNKLIDLQMQLDLANESKHAAFLEKLSDWMSKSAQVDELQLMVASLEERVDRKELEFQLELISAEAADLRKTVASLEEKIDAERILSMQHKANADMAEASKESLEAQLQSANTEIGKLKGIVQTLESEVRKETDSCEELLKQIETMKTESERSLSVVSTKESLEAQLQVSNSEVAKLRGMVNALECDAAKEKAYSSDLQMQLEAVEGIRKEVMKLKEKVQIIRKFTAKSEDAVSRKKAMEGQLEAANLEVTKLRNKVSLLQGKVEQEKLLSEEYEAKCRKLEAQVSRDSREAKLWRLTNSNGDLKVKQEKELTSAAGKLAECQKTIANLGRQLKSLTDLDGVASDPEMLESRDTHLDFRDGGDDLLSADVVDGLYELGLPKRNGSCLSPLWSNQTSGGLPSLSSYLSKTKR